MQENNNTQILHVASDRIKTENGEEYVLVDIEVNGHYCGSAWVKCNG